jgi:hypothetical protein
MTTLDELKRLFLRRRAAEATMDDPGIVAAFADARTEAIEAFVTSAPHQIEEREDAYQRLRALAIVRQKLEAAVAEHDVAEQMLERIARRTAT